MTGPAEESPRTCHPFFLTNGKVVLLGKLSNPAQFPLASMKIVSFPGFGVEDVASFRHQLTVA